ncbi:Phosphatase [Actinomadura rubteroloni]|uniref:Phosphatase n=1 Tax=Actinomadura rubteroloni TaxID=1926885 RepID=A0A2P4UJR9_9ACTN|nr:Phosphatase [Actinomadura rubteroloni]
MFDFNLTLARLVRWGGTHQAVFDRLGLPEAGRRWGDRWRNGPLDGEDHREHSVDPVSYHRWELDRLRNRARRCGVPADRVEDVVVELDRVNKALVMEPYPDAADVLGELRRRGLLVAVCSNWFWDLPAALDQTGLTGLVDVAVTSARAGARKPHPLIFHRTLAACGLRPDETVFVGDSWHADVEGPLAVGIAAIHLCRPGERPHEGRPDVPRASSLSDVLDLVGERTRA